MLTVTLPAGIAFQGGSLRTAVQDPSSGQCVPTGAAEVRCALDGVLPAGASADGWMALRNIGLPPDGRADVAARVEADGGAASPADDAATIIVSFAGADLRVDPAATQVRTVSGSVSTIDLSIVNAGPLNAADVVVAVTAPAGVALGDAGLLPRSGNSQPPGRCGWEPSGRRFACTQPGELGVGGTLGVFLTVVNTGLPAGSSVELFVELGAATVDPVPVDDFAVVPVTFAGAPVGGDQTDLRVEGGSSTEALSAARIYVSAIEVSAGPASGVAVTVALPEGVGFASAVVDAGPGPVPCAVDADRRTARCGGAALALGEGLYVSAVVVNTGLPAGSGITVIAQATSQQTDVDPGNDVLALPLTFAGGPVALDDAEAGLAPHDVGQPPVDPSVVRSGVQVTSGGPAAVTGLEVTLRVPEGAAVVWSGPFATGWGDPSVTSPVDCPLGPATVELVCTVHSPVEFGTTVPIIVDVLDLALPAGTAVLLTAQITAVDRDLDPANNSTSVPLTLAGGPLPRSGDGVASDISVSQALEPWHDPQSGWVQTSWKVRVVGTASPHRVTAVIQLGQRLVADAAVMHLAGHDIPCTTGSARVVCERSGPLPAIGVGDITVHATYADAAPPYVLSVDVFVATDLPDPQPGDDHAAIDLGIRQSAVSNPLGTVATTAAAVPVADAAALPFTGRSVGGAVRLGAVLVALGLCCASVALAARPAVRPGGSGRCGAPR